MSAIAMLVILATNGFIGSPRALTSVLRATPATPMTDHHDHAASDESGTPITHPPDHEVSHDAGTPTASEQAAADRVVRDVLAGSGRFADVEVARAEGFVQLMPFWFDDIRAAHFINLAAATDDRLLDPRHPEGLIYLKTNDERLVLLGVMFAAAPGAGARSEGSLADWHAHPELCIGRGAIVPNLANGSCLRASQPIEFEMVHVWMVSNRLGPFAHVLPPEDAAAASGQTADQTRPVPVVDEASLQAAVARVLRLDPSEISRRFDGGETIADIAASQQVPRRRLVGAIDRAVAAELSGAVTAGDLPPQGRRMIERFIAAQVATFLDLRQSEADLSPPATTAFGYPCLRVTCLVMLESGPAETGAA